MSTPPPFPTPAELDQTKAEEARPKAEALMLRVNEAFTADNLPIGSSYSVDITNLNSPVALDIVCRELAAAGWNTEVSSSPKNERSLMISPK